MATAPRRHAGFKAAGEAAANGLFAQDHPDRGRETALQEMLRLAAKGPGAQYGTSTAPQSTSVGE